MSEHRLANYLLTTNPPKQVCTCGHLWPCPEMNNYVCPDCHVCHNCHGTEDDPLFREQQLERHFDALIAELREVAEEMMTVGDDPWQHICDTYSRIDAILDRYDTEADR